MSIQETIEKLERRIKKQGSTITSLRKKIKNDNINDAPIGQKERDLTIERNLLFASCNEYEHTMDEQAEEIIKLKQEVTELFALI